MWYYFTLTACKKDIFILLMYVFFYVESESEIHFRRSEPETLDNPEKKTKTSGLSGGFGPGPGR